MKAKPLTAKQKKQLEKSRDDFLESLRDFWDSEMFLGRTGRIAKLVRVNAKLFKGWGKQARRQLARRRKKRCIVERNPHTGKVLSSRVEDD